MADISVKLSVQGEKEYREAIKKVNSETKLFETQLKAQKAALDSQTKSLSSQEQVLNKVSQVLETADKALETYGKGLETATAQSQKWATESENIKSTITTLTQELEQYQTAGEGTSQAAQNIATQIAALNTTLAASEAKWVQAETQVAKYELAINNLKNETAELEETSDVSLISTSSINLAIAEIDRLNSALRYNKTSFDYTSLGMADYATKLAYIDSAIKSSEGITEKYSEILKQVGSSMGETSQEYYDYAAKLVEQKNVTSQLITKKQEWEAQISAETGILERHGEYVERLNAHYNKLQATIAKNSASFAREGATEKTYKETLSALQDQIRALTEEYELYYAAHNKNLKSKLLSAESQKESENLEKLRLKIYEAKTALEDFQSSYITLNDNSNIIMVQETQIYLQALENQLKSIQVTYDENTTAAERYASEMGVLTDTLAQEEQLLKAYEDRYTQLLKEYDKTSPIVSNAASAFYEQQTRVTTLQKSISALEEENSEYNKSVKTTSTTIHNLENELAEVQSSFDSTTSAEKKFASQQEILRNLIKNYDTLLQTEREELTKVVEKYGENSTAAQDLKDKISALVVKQNNLKTSLLDLANSANTTATGFENVGKSADNFADLSKEFESISSRVDSMNSKLSAFSVMIVQKIGRDAVQALRKCTQALSEFGTQVYEQASAYEAQQFGLEKLYGDDYLAIVDNAAKSAEKTGISTTDYLESVTAFSANLISALENDTKTAISQADKAMNSASDNAITFGKDIEDIITVYKNLAKQQYTTLDNLQLGYAGTKEGAEQMIADANEYLTSIGETGDLVLENFSDVITAIDIAQQQLGIAGSAQEQVTKTLSGSLTALESQWDNFVLAISQGTNDTDESFDSLKSSLETFANNLLPVVKNTVSNIFDLIANNLPGTAKYLTTIRSRVRSLKDDLKNFKQKIKELKLGLTKVVSVISALGIGYTTFSALVKSAKLISSVKTLTTAFTTLKAATTFTESVKGISSLSTALSGVAGALGPVALSVAALLGSMYALDKAFESYKDQTDSNRIALSELNTVLETNKYNMDSVNQSMADSLSATLTKISTCETMTDRLQDIVDEEGNVKAGYEAEAETILTTLNEAYGTAYTLIDGKIDKYDELIQSSEDYVNQLKTQALQETLAENYSEVIENISATKSAYDDAKNALANFENEHSNYVGNITAWQSQIDNLTTAYNNGEISLEDYNTQVSAIQSTMATWETEHSGWLEQWEAEKTAVDNAAQAYLDAQSKLALVEDGFKAISEGDLSGVTEIISNLTNDVNVFTDDISNGLSKITEDWNNHNTDTETALAELQAIYDKYGETFSAGETSIWNKIYSGIKYGSEQIDLGLDEVETALNNTIDKTNEIITDEKTVNNATETGENISTGLADGITDKTSVVTEAANKIGLNTISNINTATGTSSGSSTETYSTGAYVDKGLYNGLAGNSSMVYSKAYAIGQAVVNQIKAGAGVSSPSKLTRATGAFIAEGLMLGLSDKENQVLAQAQSLADKTVSIVNGINSKTNLNGDLNLNKSVSVSLDNQAEIMAEALQGVAVVMDGQNMGRFVNKTILNNYNRR